MSNTSRGETQLERIKALEVQVAESVERQKQILVKLDDLLAVRHKGIGAFWLASALVGTGIVGLVAQFGSWLFRH